jgi:hypothetical protein
MEIEMEMEMEMETYLFEIKVNQGLLDAYEPQVIVDTIFSNCMIIPMNSILFTDFRFVNL